ncbi:MULTISPECIES: hypothetical protein [unclassified Sulfitobacter]|uniref:hypothetical protein n=1 Tax=unclassified Sulfitobacter TaxID=196795 RepID=UPI0007C293EC|nr:MULTISPECIES: hypothetical protein [unclassified Sulfitobacter]KZX99915.1 hypothetical protein A3720_11805 [Sulfitobacter sp. HI0021]KZY00172.1 hypothetical protein A3722_11475 [Sulfitobacter sp. HI0027]KZZ00418.1 hypothetical protein A3747_05305 [Sulfitobacter sp. HI0076]
MQKTSYRTARYSLAMIDFITWMGVVIAALISLKFFLSGQTATSVIVAVAAIIFAMMEFTATQLVRAQIDTADNTARMLDLMLSQRADTPTYKGKAKLMTERREPTIT